MFLDHAKRYAAEGLPIFPVHWIVDGRCSCGDSNCTNPGKHPLTPRGHRDASTDPLQLEAWAEHAPDANIGCAVPDGMAVIDVDPRNGGRETFERLTRENEPIAPGRCAATGGGGWHFWISLPAGRRLPSRLGAGIDIKQAGGYVLMPPSNHASGGRYEWINDGPTRWAPAWIQALGHERTDSKTATPIEAGELTQDPRILDAVAARVEPHFVLGQRHHTAKALGGWLKQRGFSPADVAHVIRQLPSDNPEGRVQAALAAFGIEKPFGFDELGQLVGDAVRSDLDKTTPNPRWDAELAGRANASQIVTAAVARHGSEGLANSAHAAHYSPGDPLFQPWDITAPVPPLNYLIRDFELAPGRCNMLAGYSNAGKTAIAQALAFAVATGQPVFGRHMVRRSRVAHYDYEAGEVARENYQRLARGNGVDVAELAQWLTAGTCGMFLDSPNAEPWFLEHCAGYGLVLIDTFRAACGSLDENKAEICGPLYMLGRVSRATGAAVLVLHHERKPEGTRRSAPEHMISGHNSIHGALQTAISLERDEDTGLVRVANSKRIRRGFDPFHVQFVDVPDPAPAETLGAELVGIGAPSWGLRVEIGTGVPIETSTDGEERDAKEIEALSVRVLHYMTEDREGGVPVTMRVLKQRFHQGSKVDAAVDLLVQQGKIRREPGAPERYSVDAPPDFEEWRRSIEPPKVPTE